MSGTSINFRDMLEGLDSYMKQVKSQIADLKAQSADTSGNVSPAAMFELQFTMQRMSQLIEASSNVLTNMHQSIVKCAQAIRGQ